MLNKFKIAIFIDGEFWHGYNWKEKRKAIKSNRDYWIPKIERNILRDKKNTKILRKEGWIVLRFWQRNIDKKIDKCTEKVQRALEKRRKVNNY